jgi:hypothetical protein
VDYNCVDTNELSEKNRGMATAVTRMITVVAKHSYICTGNHQVYNKTVGW